MLNHAPSDEYDTESREVLLKFQHSIEQNGMIIYEVLSKVFGTTFTKSVDECVCIAKKNNGTGITRTVKNLLFYSHRNITFREQKAILLE